MKTFDLCAIDMGQTNVRWEIFTQGKQIYKGETGAGIINLFLPGGKERFYQNLKVIRTKTERAIGPRRFQIISVGSTGIRENSPEYPIAFDILKSVFGNSKIILKSDMYMTHLGNFRGKEGIILHSGTGTFAFAIDSKGCIMKVGGWGYLLGDEGGGYWIGLEGIKAALKAYEGIIEYTSLKNDLFEFLGIERIEDVKPLIYSKRFERKNVAKFACNVLSAANGNDRIARTILERGARFMACLVMPIIRNLTFCKIDIKLTGAIYSNSQFYRTVTKQAIRKHIINDENICIEKGTATTLDGTLWLGTKCLKEEM
ncbi:MAG: hypothetical protein DRP50_04465 [Thermotoga sp.]|nr:hypothetical protein [Thermotogota bacterium]RKX54384.1 MAG: hypothetical protein DRP50_04465 [Thermotoga sp.]